MKIFISADMEGAAGITDARQTDSACPEYAFGCAMQLNDVTAAALGALDGGADEVIINDAHNHMTNLDIRGLPRGVRLTSGSPKTLGMMEGFDECDGMFFLCYHAMAGTERAILDHTICPVTVYSIALNGMECGEIGINAACASEKNVPLLLVTGDDACCRETNALFGDSVVTAEVKKARGRCAATSLLPQDSAQLIRAVAEKAVRRLAAGQARVMDFQRPWTAEIAFHTTAQCDAAATVPFVQRLSGRTIRFSGSNALEMRRWISALLDLAGTA